MENLLTPPTLPGEVACRTLKIPESKEWLGVFNALLLHATKAYNWEQVHDTDLTPEECAAKCYEIYEQWLGTGACPTDLEPPYWEDTEDVDDNDDDGIPWYDELGDWFLTGFLAIAVNINAAILYKTFVPKARVAFRRGEWGSLFKILLNGLEMVTGDSYGPITELLEVDLDLQGFAASHGLGAPPWDLQIVHNGTGASTNPTPRLEVVRKKLSEAEVNGITDIRTVGGQIEIQRGNINTWLPVTNADYVRRDGSVMTGNLQMGAGTATGAKIDMFPASSQRAINIQLPVTTPGDVIRVLNSSATTVFQVTASGRFSMRGSDAAMFQVLNSSGALAMQGGSLAANPLLTIRGIASQTADLQRWESSASVLLASISNAGAAAFTGSAKFIGQSSTTPRDLAALRAVFEVNTDAIRKAQVYATVFDAAGEREGWRVGTDGANPKIGFMGATPVLRQAVSGARQQNAAVQSMLTALVSLGLITDTTTAGTAPTNGIDGASAELRVSGGYIQWRQSDDVPTWANLIELVDLQGTTGTTGATGATGATGEPGTDGEDCVECDGQPPAEATIADDPDSLCAGAFGLTDWLISVMQFNIDQLQLGLTIEETLVEFFDNFGFITAPVSTLAELLDFVIDFGVALVETALTNPDFREDVACRLYCLVKDQPEGENKFTEAVFNEWLNLSAPPFLGNAAGSTFVTLGSLVIRYAECSRRFAIYSHGSSSECELCEDCPEEEVPDFIVTFIDLPETPVDEVAYSISAGNARVTDRGNAQPSVRGVIVSGSNSGHSTTAVIIMPTPLQPVAKVEVDFYWESDGVGNPSYILSRSVALQDGSHGTIESAPENGTPTEPRDGWFTRTFTFTSPTEPNYIAINQSITAAGGTSMGWIDNVKVFYQE